jgi:hypothetical protein
MIERLEGGAFALAQLVSLAPGGAARAVKLYQKQADGSWQTDAPLEASVSPLALSKAGTLANPQTSAATVTAAGGFGDLTVAWSQQSGDVVACDNPAALSTTFSAAGMAEGETRVAVYRATVTDELGTAVVAGDVSVTLERWSVPTVDAPASRSATGTTATIQTNNATASLTGGTAPFSIAWSKRSGGAITATAPGNLTTAFSAANLAEGETRSATFDLVVTDAHGLEASDSISVSISRFAALTVSLSTTNRSKSGTTATLTTAAVTATAAGGAGPYDYAWSKFSGGNITATAPNSDRTNFTATGLSAAGETRTAKFRCTVTDANGATVNSELVTVTITRTATTATVTYDPAGGDYSDSGDGSVGFSISASAAVTWTWTKTGTGGASTVASGSSASSISFSNSVVSTDRTCTFNVTATASDGSPETWTITLTAYATGTGTNCVVVDTPVLMSDGSLKNAGLIVVGDELLTQHETTLEWGTFPVEALEIVDDEPLLELEVDGKLLRATPEHRVFVAGAWRSLAELGGKPVGTGSVVKMTVGEAHTYVAAGILSHNVKA